jgi:hypothetical protein
MGKGGQFHALAALLRKRDLVLIIQGGEWAPGVVWMGVENLTPIVIGSLDYPAHNGSLYQLC